MRPTRRTADRVVTATRRAATATALATCLMAAGPSAAQPADVDVDDPSTGWTLAVVPAADFYPHYIADPIRAQSALSIVGMVDSEIPETSGSRWVLRLGGRFPILRCHPVDRPEVGWQLDFEGGFFGHFDVGNSLDNIGWDGLYGLLVSWKPSPSFGIRFGRLHDSPHVGDEYAERTGRQRLDATREEYIVGASMRFDSGWRVYAEGGYGIGLEEFQDPFRVQTGLEYPARRTLWGDRLSWYGAVDVRAYQETDWEPRTTAQLGLMLPWQNGYGRYRLAIELSTGRSALGEFLFRDESSVGIAWYFDF